MRFNILVITATAIVGLVASSAMAAPIIYDYSGATQTYVVPSGVTNLHVSLWGAGGGGKLAGREGAAGAYITGDLAVTPGQSLIISVGGGGTGGFAGFGSTIFQGGAGGGGYSGIFLNSVSIANALVVAPGGGGGGTSAGTLPLLAPSALPSTLIGGNGGSGGVGGPGGSGTSTGSVGIGGQGGGGAGGGYDGGIAGIAGATGSSGTSGGTQGPGGMGGPGGNGSNGGPAGSYFSLLTSFNGQISSGSVAVGALDPNFSALNSGSGGLVFAAGGRGRIVIDPSTVPEPSSLALLAIAGLACLPRHRSAEARA